MAWQHFAAAHSGAASRSDDPNVVGARSRMHQNAEALLEDTRSLMPSEASILYKHALWPYTLQAISSPET